MIEQQKLNDYVTSFPDIGRHPAGGHFVTVRLDDFSAESVKATQVYSRKDFYKISLITGHATYYYHDRKYEINAGDFALIFTNSEIPYRWEIHNGACSGYACMFTNDFLPMHTYHRPADWKVFGTESQSVFMLSEEQKQLFETLLLKMMEEQQSAYENKYELLFLYVLECIHKALQLQSYTKTYSNNAAARVTESFKLLLASQFPLIRPQQRVALNNPQAFANKLAIHPNYLNRALKTTTGKTTTQLLTERSMQEARALLLHSNWSVSQISYSLGYDEPTHFAQAFKKYTGEAPTSIRLMV
jgi:AraC family transcriptional activator of pobA